MPTDNELMELVYANKVLAKTIEAGDERNAKALEKIEDLLNDIDKKLEVLPLVLASKLEPFIEKRTTMAFEDMRVTLDELRNKLWAVSGTVKKIRENTGTHSLPSREQFALQEKDREGVSIKKGKWRLEMPLSEETLKAFKWVGIILLALATGGAATGGIWALVERIKHALGG